MGKQKIYFNKRDDLTQTDIVEVDWESWTLKKAKNELHNLDVTLKTPVDWINKNSETGLDCNIGDEIGLYATFGMDTLNEGTKRFGGYITSVDSTYDGSLKASFTVKDYKQLLKNKIVFKDYYKNMPQTIGQYSKYINKMYSATTLYDSICGLCEMVDITDFTLLETPYKWVKANNSPLTRNIGSYSNCVTYSGILNKFGENSFTTGDMHQINLKYTDSEVEFEIYDNATGYDAMAHPHLGLTYHRPPISHANLGFKFVINGTTYYLPWFDDLTGYTGNFLTGLVKTPTSQPATLMIPLKDLMDELYTDSVYNVTYISLISKDVDNGSIYVSNIGAIDGYQATKMTHDYSYKDGLEIANQISLQCGHDFEINPYKQPILNNVEQRVTNKYVIEGTNLISATLNCDDTELVNNGMLIAKEDDKKAIVCQQIDLQSILEFGEYDIVDENSDIATIDDGQKYIDNIINMKGSPIPTITCKVLPDFDYEPGEHIYVYIPSMGIERTLEIVSVTWDNTGGCELELGQPDTTLQNFLINLSKNQKVGRNKNSQGMDKIISSQRQNITNTGSYISPRGLIRITGRDLVEIGVELHRDVMTSDDGLVYGNVKGDPYWKSIGSDIFCDERGLRMRLKDTNPQLWFPLGLPFSMERKVQLEKIRITYSYTGMATYPPHIIYADVSIYSHFDIDDKNTGFMFRDTIATHGPTSSSGSVTAELILSEPEQQTLPDLPFLDYYHLLFEISENEYSGGEILIESIEIEYISEGNQDV
jgi:hypothetical protein